MYELKKNDELGVNVIISRLGSDLPSLSNKAISQIQSRMPEINRASKAFGRSNSPVENKLMTLSIISHSPYKRLKQCLAEIERKRNALKEAYFKMAREENQINRLEYRLQNEDLDEFCRRDIEIELAEAYSNMADRKIYVEGALKSIADFQDAYEQIIKNYKIPENWDEKDFIEAEVEHHIKTVFTQAVRDMMSHRSANVGNCEYFQQYGISPVEGYTEVLEYLKLAEEDSSITSFYSWLDRMYSKYKDNYKYAMEYIGLDTVYNTDFIYLEEK